METQKSKANRQKPRTGRGFSAIELLITATILTIITGLGLMGISRAKASIRLSGAAREYASYIEKARLFSVRRHADDASERASVVINADKTSYDVTMDLDGDGGMDTRTISLPSGVIFDNVEAISFDWRGRTWNTVGGITTSNAQVSIRLKNSIGSISIDVTGSGDVTIDSKVFDDSVPNVNLKVSDLASGATPTPTPYAIATPDVIAVPDALATPDATLGPLPTPSPDLGGGLSSPTPLPTPMPTATPAATATPTPTPTATPTPTPIPVTCSITTDLALINLSLDGTATIKVSLSSSGSVALTAASSKPAELQVGPAGPLTLDNGSTTTFTIKSKRSAGNYSVTFRSSCDTKTVPVIIL